MIATFIEQVFQNLLSLLPFIIVKSYQRGCRWTFGKDPKELEPGFRWRIPLLHQIEVYNVVDEMIDLPVQSVITKDKKLVCFKVSVGYRISDVVQHCCNVQDFFESTAGVARMHLAEKVRQLSLEELESDLGKLEKSLRGTLTTKMKRWGTEVFDVGFTDFAEVPRQMRIFLDQSAHALTPFTQH